MRMRIGFNWLETVRNGAWACVSRTDFFFNSSNQREDMVK
jgi:hypothetical protein